MKAFHNGGSSSAGRASDCGSECRGFKSHLPPHTAKTPIKTHYLTPCHRSDTALGNEGLYPPKRSRKRVALSRCSEDRSQADGALHMEKEISSLELGKKADFIMLNLKIPNVVPMLDVYSQVVYALKASEVDVVVVGGKPLLKDGKLLTVE